ncbi:MAG: alpha/beta hydrolase-fold protein [Polyangia bacterium]
MAEQNPVHIERFTIQDPVHGELPCIELAPRRDPALPILLFLYGGGGSCETLLELAPLLSAMWSGQQPGAVLPACRVITPGVAPWDFYLDDPARGSAWESAVAERLVDHLQRPSHDAGPVEDPAPVGLLGISMGGYGALKMALARPARFRAVAAVAPMVEPAFTAAEVRPRNRFHYPPEVPAALLGRERDAALYEADHPAGRAVRNAEALRRGGPALYLDAGACDALNAHDGAEFLHRVLWQLDIRHEYHLWADADHVGPSLLPRLQAALRWVAGQLAPMDPVLTPLEREWQRFLDAGAAGPPPPPLSPLCALMPRVLRAALAPLREAARREDETVERVFGALPPPLPKQ